MKKKKGFTLIELLAVIVVLAVLMVITVPKILEVIENADKQAYKESVELMVHTARLQYETGEITGGASKVPEGGIIYEFENGEYKTSNTLNFKGDKPLKGSIIFTEDKKVIINNLVSKNQKWCAIKDANEKNVRVGRATDPDFACIVEEDKPIKDEYACTLATNKDETIYYIDSPSDLYAFSQSVNSGVDYSNKTIKVRNDLDMSTAKGECVTSFDPIGTFDHPFNGTFDGGAKIISNLTINKSGQNYVGLFGYVKGTEENKTNIHGIRIINDIDNDNNSKGSITGSNYVGGLVGYVDSYTTIKEIELDNINIIGSNDYVGGFSGKINASSTNIINNILIKNGKVSAYNNVGYLSGTENQYITHSIVENMALTYTNTYSNSSNVRVYTTNPTNYNTYHSSSCTIKTSLAANSYDSKGINDINFYESAGLDTWIGGDDESGYYFDYDSNNKIILKSTKNNPTKFDLSKDNEENYLISNANDWKTASLKPQEKYKIVNNIDFSNDKYYMLGSSQTNNKFEGTLIGNDKTISNIKVSGTKANYLGMIGYVNGGTIYGLNIKNIEINGNDYVGLFGYITGTETKKTNIYGIRIVNEVDNSGNSKGSITGCNYLGGLVGYVDSYTTIKEIELDNINVIGDNNYIGGLSGKVNAVTSNTINNILIKKGNLSAYNYIGYLSGTENQYIRNSIVENMALTYTNTYSNSSNVRVYTTNPTNYNTYHSSSCTIKTSLAANSYDSKGINDINFYESAGLDTWIGGDNDTSGYYFDYDSNNKIILKSTNINPITFNLSKDSNDNYLIKNYNDWKEASVKNNNKYKLETNIDFSNNKYYMLGSSQIPNIFSGTLNGNNKTISNIKISGTKANYLGMIGYVNGGTIYGLNIKNIEINGNDYVGLFGYITGTETKKTNIYGIRIVNEVDNSGNSKGSITGCNYLGGLVGYVDSYTTIKEIELDNINVIGDNNYIGGLSGKVNAVTSNTINNILIKKGNLSAYNYIGYLSGYNYGYIKNAIVENMALTYTNTYSNPENVRVYTSSSSYNTYHSNACTIKETINGTFDSSNIDNIYYYKNVLETLFTGDANTTGYFFDLMDDGKIHLRTSYTEDPVIDEETGETIKPGVCSKYSCTCECGCDCGPSNGEVATRCQEGCNSQQ